MTGFGCLIGLLLILGWIIDLLDSNSARPNPNLPQSDREMERWMEQNPIRTYAFFDILDGDLDGMIDFESESGDQNRGA
jgi:hypothetical protein